MLGLLVLKEIVDHQEEAFLGPIPGLREIVIEVRFVGGLDCGPHFGCARANSYTPSANDNGDVAGQTIASVACLVARNHGWPEDKRRSFVPPQR